MKFLKLLSHLSFKRYLFYRLNLFVLLVILSLPFISFGDAEKEKLEYNFAKDNIERIEEQALKTYESIINRGGLYKNQAILDVGKHYYKKGKLLKSVEYLNKIYRGIEDEEICAEANLYKGRIFCSYDFSNRDLNETFASLFYIIDVYPDCKFVKDAILELARVYMQEKDFENAIKSYMEVIVEYPNSSLIPDAIMGIGLSYLRMNNLNLAIPWFKKLIDEYPDNELSELARKYCTQIFKINIQGNSKGKLYRIDRSFNPNFESIKAKSLSFVCEFAGNRIKTADYSQSYEVDLNSGAITLEPLKDVVNHFSFMYENYYTLIDTGIINDEVVIPLSLAPNKGDTYRPLRNIICADKDSKGNFYVIDRIASGLHMFSREFKHLQTIETGRKVKLSWISIDPSDRIYLLSQQDAKLIILDESGEEIETIDLEEKFELSRPSRVEIDWIGNKFIFDDRKDSIFIFNQENELVYRFFLSHKEAVLVKKPKDFCIDEFSNIFVLDADKNNIVKFK